MRISIIVVLLLVPLTAHAQVTWPADGAFLPLRCDDRPMSDAFADESGALDERDIVGEPDDDDPAGLRAGDATNLYLRMRLEADAAPNGQVRPFTWGMEFDTDNDATDYEILILVDGVSGGQGSVQLFRNTATTLANDPNDPADQPAVAMYTFVDNARSVTAAGTMYGGSPDFFLDFAVPWSALVPLGLDHDTPTYVWAATSSSPNSLNGDFACHLGGSGAPTLDGTASDPTTGDPNNDPAAGNGRLEGGAGCAVGAGASPLLVLALLVLRRKRRASVV